MMLRKKLAEFLGRGRRVDAATLLVEGRMPALDSAGPWLNSAPLAAADLAGRVVLIDFWTYSCINCLRTLPHLQAWHEAYGKTGLTIIGVHTPEFDFEKETINVQRAAERHGLTYPIVLDNDYVLWNRYRNRCWPAHYFIDAGGNIRYRHFGEGDYAHSEEIIRTLLAEAGKIPPAEPVHLAEPTLACAGQLTPETYLGFDRVEYLGSPE
ncbi:MAG: redoxin domain-containing protein, partial [Patescibacteria group bacterium]